MSRSVHHLNFGRDVDAVSIVETNRPRRHKHTIVEEHAEVGPHSASLYKRPEGWVACLTIQGTVPEIPEIENLGDTGWSFEQVMNQRTAKPILVFRLPENSTHFLQRILHYYIILYGD